jgi:hypothetical protein
VGENGHSDDGVNKRRKQREGEATTFLHTPCLFCKTLPSFLVVFFLFKYG